jgi:hypothetical protein
MLSPYGLNVLESCLACQVQGDTCFRDLSTATLQAFEAIKYTSAYPQAQCFSWKVKLRVGYSFFAKVG